MTVIPAAPAAAWEQWRLNMAAEVAAFNPRAEPPWTLEPLVIPGALAVVAGQGGGGKTWVLHEAAHAVVSGATHTGMQRRNGAAKALIIDAEMGRWLTVQRFAQQGYDTSIDVLDATGRVNLTDPTQRQLLHDAILALDPDFIGLDSLAALTPGADENSRDIAQFVGWLRKVCKGSDSVRPRAGMLLHHAGWKEERTRGSSAIRDSCDAVWYLRSIADGEVEPDESTLRELTCRGVALKAPRWAAPPSPLYLRLRESGGLVAAERPDPPKPKLTKTEERLKLLRDGLANGTAYRTKAELGRLVGLGSGRNKEVQDLIDRAGACFDERENRWVLNGAGPAI